MGGGKESMKRSRQKLRENVTQWLEHKKKERERIKEYRQKVKNLETKNSVKKVTTAKQKQKNSERMRQYRAAQKYKMEHPESNKPPYKTKQTLYKAVNRVRKVLPMDINRKRAVLKQLCKEFYPEIATEICKSEIQKKKNYKKVQAEKALHSKVLNFYQRDDISYQTPGKSDVISIKIDNKRVVMQKRYMIMTLKEAYQIYFNETQPNKTVGKSTFFELRPKNIMVVADTPHNVCVCQTHANFSHLCSALKNIRGFPLSYSILLKDLCCNVENESCMMGECLNCETNVRDVVPILLDYSTNIFWKKWEKEQGGRIKEIVYTSSVGRAVDELQVQLPKFKIHSFINNIQTEHFKTLKNTITEDEVVIQIDFAENFAIFQQDEVQAAHFSYEQVTVFTACIWTKTRTLSIAIISNDLTHDKYCVWKFLTTILDYIRSEVATFKKCHIFSDGCAAQFKNKFILSSLIKLELKFNMNITWSFFATSHGKGAVDGIGATVKRTVWTEIKSRRTTINNAEEFANCAAVKLKNIKIFYISKESIVESRSALHTIWENTRLPGIPNLQLQHFLEVSQTRILSRLTYKSIHYKITEYTNYL